MIAQGFVWTTLFVGLFLAMRVASIWPARHRGCDAYYFLIASEIFRATRKLPINIPGLYLLEPDEQWYPPLFTVILGALPKAFVERYYWLLNHLFDALVGIGIFAGLYAVYGVEAAFAGGIAYALTAFMILEYANLTSRAMAGVALPVFVFGALIWSAGGDQALYGLSAALAAGTFLLFSHKLSVQLLWFLMPFFALAEQNPMWLIPLPGAYLLALLIGRRHFVNILRAHLDIVTFWNRHWRFLGAHVVNSSPVYGRQETGAGYHRAGLVKGNVLHARRLLQYNPWIIAIVPALLNFHTVPDLERFLLLWIVGSYIWAGLTSWVPFLKCLGEGTKYIKFTVPPTLFIAFGWVWQSGTTTAHVAIAVSVIVSLILLLLVVRHLWKGSQESGVLTPELEVLLKIIKADDSARIMCLPPHLCDLLAYYTRRPVLWGSHGFGFNDQLAQFFPVMKERVEHFADKYQLTHLLLDENYTSLSVLGLEPDPDAQRSGSYVLYPLK